jgi:tripeptide aminopeptidase
MNKALLARKELLIEILSIQTTSGNEFDMIAYIHRFCRENVPSAEIVIKNSNIYITKGKAEAYPCIVAHTDTVHDIHKFYKVFEDDNCLFAFNSESGKQVGVGGDDKVGIWLALEMLIMKDNIKCAFFHSEEIGCIGSSDADMDWFKDVGYCLQGDRRGSNDFVNNISGKLFSKAFSKNVAPILKEYGYKETSGSITDVGQLADNGIGVCVANMSCGYYEPHSDEEIVEFLDSNNCLNMMDMLVKSLGCNRYEYQREKENYNSYDWGDFKGANKDYWYGDYGASEVRDNEDGDESCYYCGCTELMESEFTDEECECRYCPDCNSDIILETKKSSRDNELEFERNDISDGYDDGFIEDKIPSRELMQINK